MYMSFSIAPVRLHVQSKEQIKLLYHWIWAISASMLFGYECEVSTGAKVTFAQRWGVAPGAIG